VRVDWVHPSWRDLVIDSLGKDPAARRRFLRRCGVDGAAIALFNERPLLREDADWDALGDGLYHLCADIDEPEAVRLLHVLAEARDGRELEALAELVLKRLGWAGRAVGVDAIGAWMALAARLESAPDPPAVAMTWLELEPHRAPETPDELERMADWLRLAEILSEREPELLRRLGFPARHEAVLEAFATAAPYDEPPIERELRLDALQRLAVLDPALTAPAISEWIALSFEAPPEAGTAMPLSRGFPVERVLRDL
jgi:hypothetical protein